MSIAPTTGERAAAALEAYWLKAGLPPDQDTAMRAHAAIQNRLPSGGLVNTYTDVTELVAQEEER